MKKWAAVILVFMMMFVTACGNAGSEAPANGASSGAQGGSEKKIKVGVSYQNLQNEYIVAFQESLKAQAQASGVELIEADGQGKAENQINQVENFITQQVDVIILNPIDKNACAPAVDRAVAANIPIITAVADVANQDKVTAHVGSNDVEAGKMEMQFMADALQGKGNIAIIHGPNGQSAEINRTEGNYEILKKYPDIKVLVEQTANWSRAEALALTENWLQSQKLDAIVAQNDEMALGALKAVEAAGKLNEIKIIGIDAIPDALKAVEDGKLMATVFQDAKGQGKLAVEVAMKVARKEQVDKVNTVPFKMVTKENLSQFK